MPRERARRKHTVYFELLEACHKGGCPVCTMTADTVARYLDAVMYENVNDPTTREALVSARGYCNSHSWELRRMNAGLGTAMIYGDVIRHAVEAIDDLSPGDRLSLFGGESTGRLLDRMTSLAGVRDRRGRAAQQMGRRQSCPACTVRDRYEKLYLDTLVHHAQDEDLAVGLRASGGLCFVHLDILSAGTDVESVRTLLAIQRECMVALTAELNEFIRKHDYRYASEPIGPEAASWIRALEMVAGKEGSR